MRHGRPSYVIPEATGFTPAVLSMLSGVSSFELRFLLIAEPRGSVPRGRSALILGRKLSVLRDDLRQVSQGTGGTLR